MGLIPPRRISSQEVAVVRAMLTTVPITGDAATYLNGVESSMVCGTCDCGCDTVDFSFPGMPTDVHIIADALGTTPTGGQVGLILWGNDLELSCLEVYDMDAGEGGIRLPVPSSVRDWGE